MYPRFDRRRGPVRVRLRVVGVPFCRSASASSAPQQTEEDVRKKEATLRECLALLKGPTDERRFVGLLLVTKFLSSDSDDTLRAIAGALEPSFLARLVAPVPKKQRGNPEAEARHASGQELALAVSSSLSRSAALAASPFFDSLAPSLVAIGAAPITDRSSVRFCHCVHSSSQPR